MFAKAKTFMEEHLKAFGVTDVPPIVETSGEAIAFRSGGDGVVIAIGSHTDIDALPMAEWLIVSGKALLHQNGSDIALLHLAPESEANEANMRAADDLHYVADLAAIYQCYLQNPVEAYCIYDDAIELNDEASLHPIAVALGLSHPRGLEAMGFDRRVHAELFAEADFFKALITRKHPDLSLLVALQSAWQKQQGSELRLSVEEGIVRFAGAR